MSEQYHTNLHKYDLKLRLLLINVCNFNCSYCLNDFQDKQPMYFLNKEKCFKIVDDYMLFCKEKEIKSEIYLSGGEPTLHPHFYEIVNYINRLNPYKFILCTNGINVSNIDKFYELHISIHKEFIKNDFKINDRFLNFYSSFLNFLKANRHTEINQIVFSFIFGSNGFNNTYHFKSNEINYIKKYLIENNNLLYLKNKFVFKVYADIFHASNTEYMTKYKNFINNNPDILNRGTNFKPNNRGLLCTNCNEHCVTLKAIWVFPEGIITPCPNFKKTNKYISKINYDETNLAIINKIYEDHVCSNNDYVDIPKV